jgi:hypothetical protein
MSSYFQQFQSLQHIEYLGFGRKYINEILYSLTDACVANSLRSLNSFNIQPTFLRSLHLNVGGASKYALTYLIENLAHIETCRFSNLEKVTDEVIANMAVNWKNLTSLSLDSSDVSSTGLKSFISSTQQFTSVSFISCPNIDITGLKSLLTNSSRSLRELIILKSPVYEEEISEILYQCRNVRLLNFNGALFSDIIMQAISNYTPNIKDLYLSGTESVTDTGIWSLTQGCQNIEVLFLDYCPLLTLKSVETLIRTYGVTLKRLYLGSTVQFAEAYISICSRYCLKDIEVNGTRLHELIDV